MPRRPLTVREIQVLRELAAGRSYREVATSLGISPHTARRHIEQIYRKLGVKSKLEAVDKAREHNFFLKP
jgi:DNA-binding CsgD family transcriptional regulator